MSKPQDSHQNSGGPSGSSSSLHSVPSSAEQPSGSYGPPRAQPLGQVEQPLDSYGPPRAPLVEEPSGTYGAPAAPLIEEPSQSYGAPAAPLLSSYQRSQKDSLPPPPPPPPPPRASRRPPSPTPSRLRGGYSRGKRKSRFGFSAFGQRIRPWPRWPLNFFLRGL